MTITISWWVIPIALVFAGIVGALIIGDGGSYDFVSPLFAAAIFFIFVAAAIGITVGHWL